MPVIALALFVVLLFVAAPLYLVLFAPSVLTILALTPNPPFAIADMMVSSLNESALLDVPMYLLLGNLLVRSGAAKAILDFFGSLVRHWPGGLALVSVLASVFFAGMTSSSVADAAAVGSIMIPALLSAGYDRKFVTGLIVAGGTLGVLIPPSFPMILYALITGESVGRLFMAGIGPGLFLGAVLLGYTIIMARIHRFGWSPAATWRERGHAFLRAAPILVVPILLLGSIYGGWATPTEAAAVAVVYTFVASKVFYRELTLARTHDALRETARMTAMIMLILAVSHLLGFVLTYVRLPQTLTEQIVAAQVSAPVFLLIVNGLLLLLGIPLEPPPMLFMTMPVLHPLLRTMGIDPIHFGMIIMVNLQLAVMTPPVGAVLFVVAAIAKAPVHEVFRGVMPFVLLFTGALLVITFWPALSLTLGAALK